MLTENDKNYVVEILAAELGAAGQPRQALVAAFYRTTFAEELSGDTPRALAIDAVRLCLRDAWNHDPTWLEKVIYSFNLIGIYPAVADILERSRRKPAALSDPLNVNVLCNGIPFVNRKDLRNKISKLNRPTANTQPILIVNGAVKSGKSYSHNFIDHFSNYSASIFVYKYEFDNDLGLEIGPERIASDLVSKMGKSLVNRPSLETNLKLYTRQLALWVLNEAAQTHAQHWFVLDNFSGDKLRPDTYDFIIALTENVTTGMFQRRCRIILIGFDSLNLTIDQAQYDEEFVRLCSLEDIKITITEIISFSPCRLDPEVIFTFIFNDLANGDLRMPELNSRLRALLLAINSLKETLIDLSGVDFQEVLLNILSGLPIGKAKLQELKKRLLTLQESIIEIR